MQEILPLVLSGGDLTPVQTAVNWDRVPWLEEKRLAQVVDKLASPRALVTHFQYSFMPPSFRTSKAKVSGWRLGQTFPGSSREYRQHCMCSALAGSLCHEEPKRRPGVFILLPPDGRLPGGSGDFWWVYGKIPGWQRSENPNIIHIPQRVWGFLSHVVRVGISIYQC